MEDFIDDYLDEDDRVKRFRVLNWLTSEFFTFIYVSTIIIGIILFAITESIPQIKTDYFGISGFTTLTIFVISIIISIGIYRIFIRQKEQFGLNTRLAAYHYLASAINEFQESNPEKAREYLLEFLDYAGASKRQVLHPDRQNQLAKFIQIIEDSNTRELERQMAENFSYNMEQIIEDTTLVYEKQLKIPTSTGKSEKLPSKPRIIIDALANSLSYSTLQSAAALAVIILAIIGLIIGGTQIALIILAAFPVIQFTLSIFGEDRSE